MLDKSLTWVGADRGVVSKLNSEQKIVSGVSNQCHIYGKSRRTVVSDNVSINSSDIIVDLSFVADSVYNRLSHYVRPERVVDSKMRLMRGDEAQSAIKIVDRMASLLKKFVVRT